MADLEFYVRYNEGRNIHYYERAKIERKKPEIGDVVWYLGTREIVDAIRPAWLDCEQPSRDVYRYDIYQICVHDEDDPDECGYRYIAIEKEV